MFTGVFSIPLPGSNIAAGGTPPMAVSTPSGGQRVGPIVDRFIAGPENRLLAAVAKDLAMDNRFVSDRSIGNPLVLCAPSGSGKTHLALGLAEIWKQHEPTRTICVVSSEWLGKPAVRGKLRRAADGADCLLIIEDVQRLPSTPTAQRKLRSLLDESVAVDQRVIVTSSDIPGSLESLPHDVRSRLVGGLTVCISKPSRETRVSIINAYAEAFSVSFTASAVALLARSFETTAGKLVLAVKEIISWLPKQNHQAIVSIAVDKNTIDKNTVGSNTVDKNLVQRYLEEAAATHCLTISRLAGIVARQSRTTVAQLRGRSRHRCISATRNLLMYLAHKQGQHSFASIGKYLGGRDHTTILHGCRNIERQLLVDTTIQHEIRALSETIAEEKLTV